MSYEENKIRLRGQGILPMRFYKVALVLSVIANALLIAALSHQAEIDRAVTSIRSLVASLG